MITEDTVRKIAHLAYLEVNEDDIQKLLPKLAAIIGYVDKLKAYEVKDVEAMSHVHGINNVFREDELAPSSPFEMLAQNVPDTSGRFIRVPLVVE